MKPLFKNINFESLIYSSLPPNGPGISLRTLFNMKWIYLLILPIRRAYDDWLEERQVWHEKSHYTAQTNLLEKLLNQKFDPIDEQIFFEDPDWIDYNNLFNVAEGHAPIYIYNAAEVPDGPFIVNQEEQDLFQCIVWIPDTLADAESINKLKTVIDFYKPVGKKYIFQVIP